MRQTQLFTKTRKEAPTDEVSKNAQLLIRAGFINKEMAGVYDFLPLGLRVLNKVIGVIREEMNAIGGQEISMTSLQRRELWEKHFKQDRWSDENVDVWFKTKLKDGADVGLAFTHEEPISNMLEQYVSSYKDLPFSVYQFQNKFRNETRAKSGLMRTREFIMKDLYSFARTEEEHNEFYEKAKNAYLKVFERVGLGEITHLTFASGGSFSKFSHEFQTETSSGEDVIYLHNKEKIAINKEVFNDEVKKDLGLDEDFTELKTVEVGNIFTLSTKFSDPHLAYKNDKGEDVPVFMGSYGIGPARVLATVVETLSDDNGIVWPSSISPFQVHLIHLGKDEKVAELAEDIYKTLEARGIEVLFDDRDARAGEKFADSDLIGIPTRVIVGDKTLESKMLEVKDRKSGEVSMKTLESFLTELQK